MNLMNIHKKEDCSKYFPDEEEILDVISFLNNCQNKDLVDTWNKISKEWNVEAVVEIHKALCKNDRISELISEYLLRE